MSSAILPISPLTLSAPSYKMFVSQLNKICEKDGRKIIDLYGKEVEVDVVWLQGRISEIKLDEDCLMLNDGTGMVKVDSISRVPGGCPVSSVGCYVMIIGDVTGKYGQITIRALKVQDLTSSYKETEFWDLEVMDAQLNS